MHIQGRGRIFGNRTIKTMEANEHTELQTIPGNKVSAAVHPALIEIIKGKPLTMQDVLSLSDAEREHLQTILTAGVLSLAGEDREAFLNNTEAVISEESKREIWERNHAVIMRAMDALTRQRGRIPSPTEIAKETGLSRQTIYAHLKHYQHSEDFKEKQKSITVLRERMLVTIYEKGIDGDMRAAKIFMEATEPKNSQLRPNIKNQQNNLIQINGVTITQEQLATLPTDKQQVLQELLTNLQGTQAQA